MRRRGARRRSGAAAARAGPARSSGRPPPCRGRATRCDRARPVVAPAQHAGVQVDADHLLLAADEQVPSVVADQVPHGERPLDAAGDPDRLARRSVEAVEHVAVARREHDEPVDRDDLARREARELLHLPVDGESHHVFALRARSQLVVRSERVEPFVALDPHLPPEVCRKSDSQAIRCGLKFGIFRTKPNIKSSSRQHGNIAPTS